ncbi:MAG: hypothetical protein HFF17_00200 [Oscillospiraceae bacterium]|nr:hypothetical protein [Oscillospiraceae bacterium]
MRKRAYKAAANSKHSHPIALNLLISKFYFSNTGASARCTAMLKAKADVRPLADWRGADLERWMRALLKAGGQPRDWTNPASLAPLLAYLRGI